MNKSLICTSIPYVNGKPHVGHALEYTQADALARYNRLSGTDVFFTAGSDENALKNVESAEKAGKPIAQFIAEHAQEFFNLKEAFNITFDDFIRTSVSEKHTKGSQKIWELCKKDIYKKRYEGLYCTGCETFYKDGEFENNICPNHNRQLELVIEENYFFALSRYEDQIRKLITDDIVFVKPESKKNEMLAFLDKGLEDISVSRPSERTKNWGIAVPGDDSQRMYVWFDALTNYISILDFGTDGELFQKFWATNENKVQIVGKDIARFHAIIWVGMLLSAGLALPNTIFVHGFITVEGKKMSKSLGNVVDPFDLVKEYGTDATRYYFLREIPSLDDGDYSQNRMTQLFNNDLANELGNLVVRLTNLSGKDNLSHILKTEYVFDETLDAFVKDFQFNLALEYIWSKIKALNKSIDDFAPWKKQPEERKEFLEGAVDRLEEIATMLLPFLPHTGEMIRESLSGKIEKSAPLFPKKALE